MMTPAKRRLSTNTVEVRSRVGRDWAGADDWLDDVNPSDLQHVVARSPLMPAASATAAIDAATASFHGWSHVSALERALFLSEGARLLRIRHDQIARDISREMGKTIAEAHVEVTKSADFLDFYAGTARLPRGEILNDARPSTTAHVLREPVGVVVAITPWNDPLLTPARKLGPALIAGNTVVLKAAPESPLAAWHLVRALTDAGVSPGVLNFLTGDAAVIGPALLQDPRVAAVTFTGSTRTGLDLERSLAGRNIRTQLEMGGKNAAVVLDDANLPHAIRTLASAAFGQAGQRCTATSRVLVQQKVYVEVLEGLTSHAQAARLGLAESPTTTVGPVISVEHRDRLAEQVRRARAEGGKLLCGGEPPVDPSLSLGCFLMPTVLADVTETMAVWSEELFGPVVAVQPVDTADDAIQAVNRSPYGLAASVFTRDLAQAHRFIEEVDAGQVAVNLPTSGWDVHQPFGGFKDSGSAHKEQGLDGLTFYTRTKTAAIAFDTGS